MTKKLVVESPARQTTLHLFQASRRARGPDEEPSAEQELAAKPRTGKINRSNWQRVALWIFVAVAFAVFVLAGCLIWAKCRGTWIPTAG